MPPEPSAGGLAITRDSQTPKPRSFRTGDGWFAYNLAAICLDLKCVAVRSASYICLPKLAGRYNVQEGYSDDFITIAARNFRPERCFTCQDTARWRYQDNPYAHLLLEHAPHRGSLLTSATSARPQNAHSRPRQSPRVCVGCYDNTQEP